MTPLSKNEFEKHETNLIAFEDWLKNEVSEKLAAMENHFKIDSEWPEIIKALVPIAIQPYHYWAQEHLSQGASTLSPPTQPAPSILSPRGVAEAWGLDYKETGNGAEIAPKEYLGERWKEANQRLRSAGFSWSKEKGLWWK